MKYKQVCIESLGYTLPEIVCTSDEIEQRLQPLYGRLGLPAGRLELMTGIRERRFWPVGSRPSQQSVSSCQYALEAGGIARQEIGCLIHGSVCRDFLEPATACTAHHQLGLRSQCLIYDVSNACLGLLNGILQAANMIELEQIPAALVVGSEGGRQLVEATIDHLNRDTTLTRRSVKPAIASLTIGSASCAILLTHKSISTTGNRLIAAAASAHTRCHDLCQSHHDQAGSEMAPLMETNSELLLEKGVETGIATLAEFLPAAEWTVDQIDRTICHQVGGTHRRRMLESLGLDLAMDYPTFPWLGNTGSAALPVTLAVACDNGFIQSGHQTALLGIGSGINCIMLAVDWQRSRIASNIKAPEGALVEV